MNRRNKGTGIDPAAFEALQRQKSSRGNSVIRHELYFDGLALKATDPPEGIKMAVEKRFGSVDKWAADFVATAKAAAGWAMLVLYPVNGRLYNVASDEHAQGPLWLAVPLVVIDTYEHTFYIDYQSKKAEYVEKSPSSSTGSRPTAAIARSRRADRRVVARAVSRGITSRSSRVRRERGQYRIGAASPLVRSRATC